MNKGRQSGRTTAQLRALPQAAIFVCPRSDTRYEKALARHIGRDDIEMVGIEQFLGGGCGRRVSAVERDHAVEMTDRQFHEYMAIKVGIVR